MKRVITITLIVLLLLASVAFADAVEGKWTGKISAAGMSVNATVRFDGSGSFRASAGGRTAKGDYSVSGNSVTMNLWGASVTMKLKESGRSQSMSGSASYEGIRGTLRLSRRVSDTSDTSLDGTSTDLSGSTSNTSIYGEWTCSADDVGYIMRLYEGGFIYWREKEETGADSLVMSLIESVLGGEISDKSDLVQALMPTVRMQDYGGFLTVSKSTLDITPLKADQDIPALWDEAEAEEGGQTTYTLPYTLTGDTLTIMGKYAFDRVVDPDNNVIDTKPEGELFASFVTLERNDKGRLVRALQEKLNELGYSVGKVDGVFGPKTEAGIKAFEEAQSLKVDGKADPEMYSMLMAG